MTLNRRAFTSLLAASLTSAARPARAQTYPTKRLLIPFAVGGAADLFAPRPLLA